MPEPQHKISLRLILDRCLPGSTLDDDATIEQLLSRTALDLSWLRVCQIDNLEPFTALRELYLQHNCIRRIEGLDNLCSLELLSLSHNEISEVQGLQQLRQLMLLDLSHNAIAHIEPSALPPSLRSLDLRGNPRPADNDRSALIASLPTLEYFDGRPLSPAGSITTKTLESGESVLLKVTVLGDDGAARDVELKFPRGRDRAALSAIAAAFCAEHDIADGEAALLGEMLAAAGATKAPCSTAGGDDVRDGSCAHVADGGEEGVVQGAQARVAAAAALRDAQRRVAEEGALLMGQEEELLCAEARRRADGAVQAARRADARQARVVADALRVTCERSSAAGAREALEQRQLSSGLRRRADEAFAARAAAATAAAAESRPSTAAA